MGNGGVETEKEQVWKFSFLEIGTSIGPWKSIFLVEFLSGVILLKVVPCPFRNGDQNPKFQNGLITNILC